MAANNTTRAILIFTLSFNEFMLLKKFETVKVMDFIDCFLFGECLVDRDLVGFVFLKTEGRIPEAVRKNLSNACLAFDEGLSSDGFRFGII